MMLANKMKVFLIVFTTIIISQIAKSQNCDSISTENENVYMIISIHQTEYDNVCNYKLIDFDTTYHIENYFAKKNYCLKLINPKSKCIILEEWGSNDTMHRYTYFYSGKLKSKTIRIGEHYEKTIFDAKYYENGQLKYGGEMNLDSLTLMKGYYSDGKIESELYYFGYYPYNVGKYYYHNGSILNKTYFTQYIQNVTKYNEMTDYIADTLFDISGNVTNEIINNKSVGGIVNINSQGPYDKKDTLISFYDIKNQEGYGDCIKSLNEAILKELEKENLQICSNVVIDYQLIINKKGELESIEAFHPNNEIKVKLENSIRRINKWNIAKIDEKEVMVSVYSWIIIKK